MTIRPKLLLVGCGHLGSAMMRQWISQNAFSQTHIVKPSPLNEEFQKRTNISWSLTSELISPHYIPDIVIIAVRPKDFATVLPAYAHYKNSLFLSLAAGKKLTQLASLLTSSHAILRAMPNIASEVGAGMTFVTANENVTDNQKKLSEILLESIGKVAWLEDENLFDIATALSGCGPGYIFAMVECLAEAAEKLGLPTTLAMKLARQMVIGSGAVLAHSEESATDLRKKIGAPGTMTSAGLEQLLAQGALPNIIFKTLSAAAARAKELAQ